MIIVNLIIVFVGVIIAALLANAIEDYNNKHIINMPFKEAMKDAGMPLITFNQGKKKLTFLVDTGSNLSFIDPSILKGLKVEESNSENIDIITGGGNKSSSKNVKIKFSYNKFNIEETFVINEMKENFDAAFPNYKVRGILGSDFLQKYGYIIDYKNLNIYCKNDIFS